MDSLKIKLDEILQEFFDDRTGDADIPDRTRDYLQKQLDNVKEDVFEIISDFITDADNTIEEFSEENIRNIKDDIRTQDYLERELFD